MDTKARLVDVARDYESGKMRMTFVVDDKPEDLDDLRKADIRLTARRWRVQRSLSANAYFWVLADKIALRLAESSERIYEDLLRSYGSLDVREDGMVDELKLLSEFDVNLVKGHWRPYDSDEHYTYYLRLKGSSRYTTTEMAHLIEGTISEAKQLGIETLPPDELERMLNAWKPKKSEAS